jgi:type I restriction enzyme S subunit
MTDFVRLGDIADLTVGHVGPMRERYVSDGVPFLRSTNIRPFQIDLDDVKYIDADFHLQLGKSSLRPGDVVVVRTGRPGAAAVLPDSLPEANCSDLVVIRPLPGNDSRFIAYYINGAAQGFVASRLVGAVQQHFNIGAAREMPIPRLPFDRQRAIADALGVLDDLIDTNRGLAAVCEDLAVHLVAPVSASTTLGEALIVVTASTRPDGTVDHFSLPAFDAGRLPVRESGSAIKSNKIALAERSLLISRLNPHIPRSWMAYPGTEATAMASTEFAAFQGSEVEFYWAACAGRQFRELMCSMVTGTTGSHQRVDKEALSRIPVPDAASADPRLVTAVALLVRQAHASRLEAADLKRTRDQLLPLLLSGRVLPGEVA